MKLSTRQISRCAVIAALYAVLTLIVYPLSFGPVQVRLSEALTVLTLFTPEAVPGLFIGCVISNAVGSKAVDMIVGSACTLLASLLSRKLRRYGFFMAMAPHIVINALGVGYMLYRVYFGVSAAANILYVMVGETVAVYAAGYVFYKVLGKLPSGIWN